MRQGLTATLVTGVDRSGKVQAQKMHYLWNCGAYGGYGVNVVRAAGYTCGGAYEFPNVWGDSIGVYTNRPVGSAYRGFGMQEIHWALEQQMDMVARELGMRPGRVPAPATAWGRARRPSPARCSTSTPGRVDLCIQKVDERARAAARRRRDGAVPRQGHRLRGEGARRCRTTPPPRCVLKFAEDATLEILISGIDYGQGLMTVAAQFAAEALDLPIEKIRVRGKPDTDLSPYDWQTVASRQTWATGNAVLKRGRADQASSSSTWPPRRSACPPRSSTLKDGKVVHATTRRSRSRSPRWSWATSSPTATPSAGRWRRPRRYVPEGLLFLDPETSQSAKPVAKWTFGAQGVELTVDPETGAVHGRARRRLLRRRQGRQPGPDPRADLRRHRAGPRHRR